MLETVILFFACILAGFALYRLPGIEMISGLMPFFQIVAVLAIIIFTFSLLYLGLRTLFSRNWL
ncbi:hypothetical protein [Bacillus sp. T33-2]|uniref:hypothetical protein n=1 Tax=Bacillus sp. T33-2 TaxID=2054168 RepID=UPI000C757B33|nr:hypothetical protein [Bacillus sp. T33-2]PLR92682.1 hypothetical protein CVD19_20740 [Bacillus sp. T33-2]